MKFLPILAFAFLVFTATAKKLPADYVNVFTGTSNSRWMMNPGPSLPLGMVKLDPDNQDQKWCGGYEYTINSIAGFSFIHGMGLSGVSIMPMSSQALSPEGNSRLFPGSPDAAFGGQWTAGYRSRIRKSEEKGTAGYYWVDAYFSGLKNLHEKFSSSNMQRCQFRNSDLAGLLLKGNNVESCDFSDSDFSRSQIQNSNLSKNQFVNCLLKETQFSGTYISGCNFSGSHFSGVNIKSGGFEKNTIAVAVFSRTSFVDAHLSDIVFEGKIEDCCFENCAFSKVTFQNSTLSNTFFKNKNLKRVKFVNCQADRITFAFLKNGKADLTGISMINPDEI